MEYLEIIILFIAIMSISFNSFKKSFGDKAGCSNIHEYLAIPAIIIIVLVMLVLMLPDIFSSLFNGETNGKE